MATATTAKGTRQLRVGQQQSRAEWEQRAVELARERHTDGTARVLAAEAFRRVYGVRKGSAVGEYIVLVTSIDVVCDCIAGQHRRPCCHAGATILAERQRAEAMRQPAPRSEALDYFAHGGEWERWKLKRLTGARLGRLWPLPSRPKR